MLHRPARTIVSVLSIAVGVLLILFTVGLAEGTLTERARRESNVGAEIAVRPSGSLGISGSDSFRLPVSLADDLRKIDGVETAIPIGQNSVSAGDNSFSPRLVEGVNFEEYADIAGIRVMQGRALGSGDEVMVDTAWQNQNSIKIGSTISIWDRPFTVVGSFEPAAGARLKIPLQTMQEQLGGEGKATSFFVKLRDPNQQERLAQEISDKFPETQVILMRDWEEIYASAIPALGIFLNVVTGIAAVISALVILLTMYTIVTERTRQIGVLKSLGMSNGNIALVVLQEALLMSLVGVITGILMAYIARFIVLNSTNLQVAFTLRWIVGTLIVGLIGGALGALYPAMRAAKLDAVEALSYE